MGGQVESGFAQVPRTRLIERLATSPPGSVTLIVAGPGYGKSTLLEQWRAETSNAIVIAAQHDDDSDQFGRRIVDAIAQVVPESRSIREHAHRREPDWSCEIVPELTGLASVHPIHLAIDDVHLLQSEAAIELVRAMAHVWPRPSTLILSSRVRPPIRLVRARLGDTTRTLSEGDLDFDEAEIGALIGGDLGVAGDLIARTGGWPAGIRCLAAASAGADEASSDEWSVTDYLRRHVIDLIDTDLVEFLAQIAVLAPAPVSLIQAVMKRNDVVDVLRHIQSLGVPMLGVPFSGEGVITIHSLLADELVQRLDVEHITDINERAVAAAEQLRLYEYAFTYAERVGGDRLFDMPYWHIGNLVLTGRTGLLAEWISRLPPREVDRRASLAIARLQTVRPLNERSVTAMVAPFRDDDTSVLPDGLRPAVAIRRSLAVLGLQPTDVDDPELSGRWGQALALRRAWHLYAKDRVDDALELLGEERRLELSVLSEATRLAELAIITAEIGELESASGFSERARDQLNDEIVSDTSLAFMVDVADLTVLRRRGEYEQAMACAVRARSQMALVGDASKLERLTSSIEIAHLYLDLGLPAKDAVGMLGDARSIVSRWGRLSRAEAALDVVVERARASEVAHPAESKTPVNLTAAELRVLHYLPSHFTMARIASELYVSANTVKTHCLSIYRKLGVGSREEAVAKANRLGMLSPFHRSG